MREGRRVNRKEISVGTTVKAVITGYIAYGILMGFICFVVGFLAKWGVRQIPTANYRALSIVLPIFGSFMLFFVMHWVCKLSIYDVFKECKTNPSRMDRILARLNLFLLIFIAMSVILVILLLLLKFNNSIKAIELASYQYNTIHSKEFTNQLVNKMQIQFQEEKANTIISTSILQMGITITCFSLIPYQKKLIEKYNKF